MFEVSKTKNMTLRDYLITLFTRNVQLVRLPGDRLKTLDINKSQSIGSPTQYSNRPKWRNGKLFNGVSGYTNGYSNEEIESMRRQMYIDYELMDGNAIIHSAVDLYAEESLTRDIHTNEVLVIKSDNPKVKKVLHNLFYDILNIQFNAFSWIRTMCKYGDMFLYLQIAPKVGIVNVQPIHPSLMRREEGFEDDPNRVVFYYDGSSGMYRSEINRFEFFEIAHFRLMTETMLLPYGMSILEGARRDYRSWTLLEDAMMLHRIMRAPERRIVYIDVGNIAPEQIDAYVESVATELKKTPYLDENGQLNLRYNLMNMQEDIFLPVRGQSQGTKIDTLPGLGNEGMLEDVEYQRKKMMAALKIPPAYLGYEGDGDTKSNLSAIDLRFGRTIERVQNIFVSELYKIAFTHLTVQGFSNVDALNYTLEFTSPSLVFERQRIDIMTAKIDLIKSIREDSILSNQQIYMNILGMTEDEMRMELDNIIESEKFYFRLSQIKDEGNDPKISGKSFGTPHDIASMQVSSKFIDASNPESLKQLYTPDEREENEGKPDQYAGSFETKRDQDFGRDPNGRKEMNKMESLRKSLQHFSDDSKILTESNLLDENRLIDDSDDVKQ